MRNIIILFFMFGFVNAQSVRPYNPLKDSLNVKYVNALNEARQNPYQFVKENSEYIKNRPEMLNKIELDSTVKNLSTVVLDYAMCVEAKKYAEELIKWTDGLHIQHLHTSKPQTVELKVPVREKNQYGAYVTKGYKTETRTTYYRFDSYRIGQDNLSRTNSKRDNANVKDDIAKLLVDLGVSSYGHRKSLLHKDNTKIGVYLADSKDKLNNSILVIIVDGIVEE